MILSASTNSTSSSNSSNGSKKLNELCSQVGSKIKATYFNSFGNKPSVPVFKPIEIMSKMRETYHKNNNSYHGKQSTAKNHLSTSVLDQTVKFKDGKVVKRTKLDKHKKISDDCMIQVGEILFFFKP
jgi:hypothetical protein